MDFLGSLVDFNALGFIWLVIAVFFLLIEIGNPGFFFFIAFAFGCIAAAPVAFLGYPVWIQCLTTLFFSGGSFLVLRKFFVGHIPSMHKMRTNVVALIGKRGIVVRDFSFDEVGLVKIGGEIWSAQGQLKTSFSVGDLVEVVAIEGNRVLVREVK